MAVVPFEMSKEMRIGIRKDWPELITILNKAIASINQKEHSNIKNKWLAYSSNDQKVIKVIKVDLSPKEQAWLDTHRVITLGGVFFRPLTITMRSKVGPKESARITPN